MKRLYPMLAAMAVAACWTAYGQTQTRYVGSNVTGQVILARTVNLRQQSIALRLLAAAPPAGKELPPKIPPRRLRPPQSVRGTSLTSPSLSFTASGLPVSAVSSAFGFNGITHLQQRLAYGGNQFSVEPPNPSIAAANGYILAGVNNGVQVYDNAGAALLPAVVSSNQLFGLPPAIDRSTNIQGVFPTDMRVFYDQGMNRWIVLQRTLMNDAAGNPLPQSFLYIAVSQNGDPTGTYNIYTMDTTNAGNWGCPCVADYPQIGSDQYGFYIAANEFNWYFSQFVDATVLALSKQSLGAGAALPTAYSFTIPFSSGYEFAIQPAVTPPGATPFLASGGLEYFVSTQAAFAGDSNVAVWAMTNTSSLLTPNPNPTLIQILVPTQFYLYPNVANQRPGLLPYGSSLIPPRTPAFLDGGDSRILSVSYSGGRLFAAFGAQVFDGSANLCGGAYVVLSPTYRAGILNAFVLRQGQLIARGNHLLRPAIAVNAAGRGAVAFTLVGPDYYPSAAFLPIDVSSTGSVIQLAAPGASPEDGFSGYSDSFGVARWGDYSTAVADNTGAIWMAVEYIPNLPRTQLANWGTFIMRYMP